jgi:predicted dehydrogenase
MSQWTRRRFLEHSALSLTALAGAGIAQPVFASPRRRGMANDVIHIAVIGVNSRGMDHVSGYVDRPDVAITAICDPDEAAARKAIDAIVKKGKPAPRLVTDIRRLLEDKELDAVSIATPNHWHALGAIWAMQAGKDVYVEKPVSHNVSEGRRIVQVARKTGRICQTGTQIRSQRGSIDAINYIHSGKIGKVHTARGLCYKTRNSIGKVDTPTSVPAGVNYDLWLGPAPEKPVMRKRFHYDWHWQWDYGNGDLGNQGIHQMDVARWALGKNGLPKSVMGLGGRFGYVDDGETPNTELIFMDYGDCQLIFEVRGLKTDKLKGAGVGNIIYGSEGYVVFTEYDAAIAYDNDDREVQRFKSGGDHYGNFLQAVRSRSVSDLHADIEEGHLSSALCHLGNISYKLGASVPMSSKPNFGKNALAAETFERYEKHLADNGINLSEAKYQSGPTLRIDSRRERFTGDRASEANVHLTREYRKGFVVPEKV